MASLNKVILIGNLTRDPDLRYTPRGAAVCDLSIAVNRKWKDEQTGESKEEVTYVEIVVWGKQAENVGKYLVKGSSACFEGRLQMETWEDKTTGQKRSKIRVVAEGVQFLGAPAGQGQQRPASQQPARRTAADAMDDAMRGAQPGSDQANGGLDGDDIPF
jgi:single-strand DNA-binding protein